MAIKTYGLTGFPLGHSFSAGFFTEKFRQEGLSATHQYLNFPVESIEQLKEALPDGIQGFNVTIPYKEQILPLLSEIDPAAREIGAVNCVKVLPDGKWKGYNTDAYGFRESLKEMLRSRNSSEPLEACVLGTGGAAKAVWYTLRELKIPFRKISRRPGDGQISYEEFSDSLMDSSRLIINTTPLGMSPDLDKKPEIPYDRITKEHYLYDLVYNPAETAFLREGRKRGAWIKNGLHMLILQAERSWDIWNDNE